MDYSKIKPPRGNKCIKISDAAALILIKVSLQRSRALGSEAIAGDNCWRFLFQLGFACMDCLCKPPPGKDSQFDNASSCFNGIHPSPAIPASGNQPARERDARLIAEPLGEFSNPHLSSFQLEVKKGDKVSEGLG